MHPLDLFPHPSHPWLSNSLLDDAFVAKRQKELAAQPLPYNIDHWLSQHYDPDALALRSEAQLEEKFIGPLLAQLGWSAVAQQSITVQGKLAKPDWCLALNPHNEEALIATQDKAFMAAICESKAWGKTLDTGKADRKDNPHHQLQDYLSTLRVRFGFLTNGRLWRLYDTDKITAKKTYIQFDLQAICALDAGAEKTEALALFAFFFGQATYVPLASAPTAPGDTSAGAGTGVSTGISAIERTIAESADFTLEVEENLKAVIYGYAGEDSLFERMGRAIARTNAKASLAAVYENAVVLLFRLLFVVYFEDKNRDLLAQHPFYWRYSLGKIFRRLGRAQAAQAAQVAQDGLHDGFYSLKHLFQILNEGAPDIDLPLFNGGLFDPQRAPLLRTPKILDNAALRDILEKLLYKTRRGTTLFDTRRDFKSMSVTHLGRIYEGLLEFRFERARERSVYLEYHSAVTKGKAVEAYFDAYDSALIRKEKGFTALREISLKKGDVYLKSANNSRKTTASYYTPTALSEPLVKTTIEQALFHRGASGKALMDLKLLDNACGSGHFLVQALNHLTDLALQRLDSDADLQQLVAQEKAKITEQLEFLNIPYRPEDGQILKRALLKRCIFGVDLNPFAVELARLSLWMDSFIFGTPLSFIEHHVQQGNALMGASVQEFIDYNATEAAQDDMFVDKLGARFDALRAVMQEMADMRDTTAEEVEQSKALWKTAIVPQLQLLSRALNFVCARRVLLAQGKKDECEALSKTPELLAQLFDESKTQTAALRTIGELARQYHFFHYEVAFPEVFSSTRAGFDAIVGNPPWDKTKFSDPDFFPQYHSNYRSLKNSEKKAVQQRLLGSAHIAQAYQEAQESADVANAYYKAAFPLNRGAGDGNLFRLFVERNLALLAPDAGLGYVLPSALMFEEGSLALRRHILTHCQLRYFHSFENRKALFLDVDSRYKFAMVQIINRAPNEATPAIDTAFYLTDAADLARPEVHIPYPLSTLQTLSPQQWALMELRDRADLPILQKCYAAFPALSPDWLDFRRELDMTNDKDLFLEQAAPGLLALYEGKMIWQYNARFGQAQYWLDPQAFDQRITSKEIHRMAQDLGVPKTEVSEQTHALRYDREFVRLAFREVARDTDERTLIFCLLPQNCGYGHTLFANVAKKYVLGAAGQVDIAPVSPLRLLFALAWFNSLPTDWLARSMVQIHVSKTYLARLPMPQPSDAEILAHRDYATLAKNALLLTLGTHWEDFAHLAPLFDIKRSDTPRTPKAMDKLRAHNDKTVARLYGITDGEFAHLIESFGVMAQKRPEYLALLLES